MLQEVFGRHFRVPHIIFWNITKRHEKNLDSLYLLTEMLHDRLGLNESSNTYVQIHVKVLINKDTRTQPNEVRI